MLITIDSCQGLCKGKDSTTSYINVFTELYNRIGIPIIEKHERYKVWSSDVYKRRETWTSDLEVVLAGKNTVNTITTVAESLRR